jgi:hypothetical protein
MTTELLQREHPSHRSQLALSIKRANRVSPSKCSFARDAQHEIRSAMHLDDAHTTMQSAAAVQTSWHARET